MAEQSRRILLHLGTHKTGSTTLQRSFWLNRERLRHGGIDYPGGDGPMKELYSGFLADPMTHVWNRNSGLDREGVAARDRAALQRLADHVRGSRCPAIVLSCEYLSMLDESEMAALRDWLAEFGSVEAIYFYRELHAWISSDSQEMAKAGLKVKPTTFEIAMQRLYEFPLRVADVFGRERTRFIRFEDAVTGGICNSFLATCGLTTFSDLGLEEEHANQSLSADAVRALFLYNRLNPLGTRRRSQETVEQLKSLPGPKYRVAGFRPQDIADYGEKRQEVIRRLGLTLAPPEELPASDSLDPLVEQNLKMVNRRLRQVGAAKGD